MIKNCPECDATWIDGQLYWQSGKMGCPHDLAGLLCNDIEGPESINHCKGSTSGATWEQLRQIIEEE